METSLSYTLARALFRCLKSPQEKHVVEEELVAAAAAISGNKKVPVFFHHPKISRVAKKEFLESIFTGKATRQLIDIFLSVKDIGLVTELSKDFQLLLKDESGIVDAEIRVPFEPDKSEFELLKKTLEKETQKKIHINIKVIPELLGGVWVRIGDRVFDNTIRKQLTTIKSKSLQH
jgi:F-type H+-transporting ATPase subunit delta